MGDWEETEREWAEGRPLGEQERLALRCLAVGLHERQAADLLGKSPHTVAVQIKHARYKLGAKTPTQAVAIAIRRGLI